MKRTFVGIVLLLLWIGSPGSAQDPATLKVSVDLVSLSVTVTDQKGQPVAGLQKKDFRVYEDKVVQPLEFFSTDAEPVSWGLVLDRSGSMRDMLGGVYQAALHVEDKGSPHDEMFIVTFDRRIELVSEFTSDRRQLEQSMSNLSAGGETALYDAVAASLREIGGGSHEKKVLVVVTDGEDNYSLIKFDDLLKRIPRQQDVIIYAVGMFEPDMEPPWWMGGGMRSQRSLKRELQKLAEVSGGAAHFPRDVKECREVMDAIAREVSQHYSLGYYPINRARDGSWRNIRVEVARQPKGGKYIARARTGYYAPSETN